MSTPHFRRRPNRRQRSLASINVSPLGVEYGPPDVELGRTTFTLGLTQSSARIVEANTGPELARIKLAGTFAGAPDTVECDLLSEANSPPAQTIIQLGFPAALDPSQPWVLSIPADTPLIQGRSGGRLAGTYLDGEAISNTLPFGAIRVTNANQGPFGALGTYVFMPVSAYLLATRTAMGVVDETHWRWRNAGIETITNGQWQPIVLTMQWAWNSAAGTHIVDLSGNALDQASVDLVLSIIRGYWGTGTPGTILLNGGTNSAPTGGAGNADVVALTAAGWTVTTN